MKLREGRLAVIRAMQAAQRACFVSELATATGKSYANVSMMLKHMAGQYTRPDKVAADPVSGRASMMWLLTAKGTSVDTTAVERVATAVPIDTLAIQRNTAGVELHAVLTRCIRERLVADRMARAMFANACRDARSGAPSWE